MNWLKVLGWGVALWAIGFVLGSIFRVAGMDLEGIWFKILMLVIMAVVTYIIATRVEMKDLTQALIIGLVWLVVVGVLDYLILVQGFNKGDTSSYYSWSMCTSYGITLLMPMLVQSLKKK